MWTDFSDKFSSSSLKGTNRTTLMTPPVKHTSAPSQNNILNGDLHGNDITTYSVVSINSTLNKTLFEPLAANNFAPHIEHVHAWRSMKTKYIYKNQNGGAHNNVC